MKKKFLRVLLLLTLFSSLGFTASLYVECQDVSPDEWLDFFGIVHLSASSTVKLTTEPTGFPNSIPDGQVLWLYHRWVSQQLSILEPVLSVILRC